MITRLAILLFALIAPALPLFAQEHPRAPQQSQSQQLPQTRTGAPQAAMTEATMSDASDGLKRFINGYAAKSADNKFHMPFQRKDLALDLVKVHDDRFSNLGGNKYFACVDMKGSDGRMYRHRFLHGRAAREIDRDRNFRSQNQRETSLQLETREGRRLEESARLLNCRASVSDAKTNQIGVSQKRPSNTDAVATGSNQ